MFMLQLSAELYYIFISIFHLEKSVSNIES